MEAHHRVYDYACVCVAEGLVGEISESIFTAIIYALAGCMFQISDMLLRFNCDLLNERYN